MTKRHYYVYVIEAYKNGRRLFYVGQSAKTPVERFKEHDGSCKTYCSTCKCRHYVPGKGRHKLRWDLFSAYNPLESRPEAEKIEKWLAARLRRQGYNVVGGH